MDQLGLVVRKIEANGLIRVERLGGVPERALPAQAVLLLHGEGRDLAGVIANKSHHATAPEEKYQASCPIRELSIDCGFDSAADALAAGVGIGTPLVYSPRSSNSPSGRLAGTSVDDRAGCAVMHRGCARAAAGGRRARPCISSSRFRRSSICAAR